jgi:hypothetical protein
MLDDPTSAPSRLIARQLPHLDAWRSASRKRLPAEPALRPAWDNQPGPVPYSTLGHAIDARLRLSLTEAAAGACFETGVSRYTTDALICDGIMGPGMSEEARELLVHGLIRGLPVTTPELSRGRRHVGVAAVRVLTDAAALAREALPWRGAGLLLEDAVEGRLCRAVFVLGWLEECFRAGRIFPGSALAGLIEASTDATESRQQGGDCLRWFHSRSSRTSRRRSARQRASGPGRSCGSRRTSPWVRRSPVAVWSAAPTRTSSPMAS